jgi:hypothetical protein
MWRPVGIEDDPAYLRASDSRASRRRRTSSYGISWTLPESMSSMRRLISCDQASSTLLSGEDGSRFSSSESAIAALASGGRAKAFFRIVEASSFTPIFYTGASLRLWDSGMQRAVVTPRTREMSSWRSAKPSERSYDRRKTLMRRGTRSSACVKGFPIYCSTAS